MKYLKICVDFYFQAQKGNEPIYFNEKPVEIRPLHTRNCHDLQIPRLNTERAKNGFNFSALKLWNDMHVDIREVSTQREVKIITENTTPWNTSNISIMPVNFFFLNILFKAYVCICHILVAGELFFLV